MGLLRFFKHLGRAIAANGLRGLVDLIPGGRFLWEVTEDVWRRLKQDEGEDQLRTDLQAVALASPEEARRAAAEVTAEVAADQPPEARDALTTYLTLVPSAVRQSLRRPADRTGTTLPSGLALSDCSNRGAGP